jgi:hypothetical protein
VTRRLAALGLGLVALVPAGCGGSDKVDISKTLADDNRKLSGAFLKIDCPKEVEKGKPFTCTVTSTKTGKSATIQEQLKGDGPDYGEVTPGASRKVVEQVAR